MRKDKKHSYVVIEIQYFSDKAFRKFSFIIYRKFPKRLKIKNSNFMMADLLTVAQHDISEPGAVIISHTKL